MITARTTGPDETRALGAALADLVRPGDVVVLAGDLGAGKTTFTQGLGAALGVAERITSPTFTIAQEHRGRVRLHHLDVYRLENLREATDVGLDEMLDDEAVVVIEWGDRILPVLPTDLLEMRFRFVDGGDDDRAVDVRPVGFHWIARSAALERALARWCEAA
ncbi:MAG: tRNA (adenosine(37)-N6)-threonylcarbamoyltransferase complex ATPase subunit type 1 TsaE [Actinobacteria bacterium]|nr:tRNA (adenosine(37)-N6)-threonylcarbamoyltransferase complex ATPase subunit type 1 TsaE [Actinomycetota bacterium]